MVLRTKLVLLSIAGVFAITTLYAAAKYSAEANEYSCEGFTSVTGGSGERDHGRLRIEHYAFWVALWNATSDGNATFQSTKFSFYEGDMREIGEGNFTIYVGTSSGRKFSFKRAINELAIDYGQMNFIGNCIAAI